MNSMCWAIANHSNERHFYGRGNAPLAICGHVGETKLDYTQVRVKKCDGCLKHFPRVERDKDSKVG